MAVTIAGILCQEEVHDYEEQYDVIGGPSAVKIYLCPWANRFTVIHGILGLSSTLSVGGLITLNTPLAFPELAAESTNLLASMYARNVVCQGVGSPVQGASNIAFTTARLIVTFGNYPWTFQGIDYFQIDPTRPYIWIEQNLDFSGEFITIPGEQVYYASTGLPLASSTGQADWGFFSPMLDVTLTLKNIPYLPASSIIDALGAGPLNSVRYLQAPPGYLMFKGVSSRRTKATDGTQTAELTYGFSYRFIAQWDCVYNNANPTGGAYQPSGTTPPYWDQVLNAPSGSSVMGHSDLSLIIPSAYHA